MQPGISKTRSHFSHWKWWCPLPARSYRVGSPGISTASSHASSTSALIINGDHGDINYIVDGLPIPQELNREIGTEIDPEDISFADVIEGAYPAQYGGRFASVVNINTRVGSGPSGSTGYTHAGSFGEMDSSLGWHTRLGAGSLVFNVRGEKSDRFLDPPNFAAVHDRGSNTNQFLRYTLPLGNDFLNITATHAYQAFQIPNDVASGEPATTDDNETQDDAFVAAQYHHALHGDGALSFSLATKRSRIRDLPDQENGFIFGENLNLNAGGTATDCATGIVSACGYSLYSDRTARDIIANIDDYVRSAHHAVRVGAFYDATDVDKFYQITLQPNNFLSPVLTPATPVAATRVTDNAPDVGHNESAYAQDTWQMGRDWDYGLRYDFFEIASTQYRQGFGMFSPRVKITRIYSPRASAYLFAGRFFTPFSLENVAPAAAQLLNLPLQPTPAQFDLRPQRDTNVEIGGHLPFGSGELGMRVTQRVAADPIDDTQVGVTALHQDINYSRGNISVQSAYYQQGLRNGGRAYLSATHARSVNKGCETQLLAPCFGQPTDWTPADHDQNWDANVGILVNDSRGGWFAIDGEYGSGLSSKICASTVLFCKVPPPYDVRWGQRVRSLPRLRAHAARAQHVQRSIPDHVSQRAG